MSVLLSTYSAIHKAPQLPASERNTVYGPFSNSWLRDFFPFDRNCTRQSREWFCGSFVNRTVNATRNVLDDSNTEYLIVNICDVSTTEYLI